eukprot:TRINITY_DN9719_c0_g1_i2.p1 TRINITY_DN9719_c0_g1~~TRINITY_DN9719_c0_g1_i2.p1  ORF type:complete len:349 (-),score=61.89 TRINITY_DN9719_c0_g1_i2:96-1142(-)
MASPKEGLEVDEAYPPTSSSLLPNDSQQPDLLCEYLSQTRLGQLYAKIVDKLNGPKPPHPPPVIHPWFPRIQLRYLQSPFFSSRYKSVYNITLSLCLLAWLIVFSLLVNLQLTYNRNNNNNNTGGSINTSNLEWRALFPANFIFSFIVIVLLCPSALVTFWTLICAGYWYTCLVSAPRFDIPFLPALFDTFFHCVVIAYLIWRVGPRFSLRPDPVPPLERFVFLLVPFWFFLIGSLYVSFFNRAGIISLIVISSVSGLYVIITQFLIIYRSGYFLYYLRYYTIGSVIIVALSLLPHVKIHIHHFFIGMVFMPLTAYQTRMNLFYMACLLGLFLQGAGKWGIGFLLDPK